MGRFSNASDVENEDTNKIKRCPAIDAVCRCCHQKGYFEAICQQKVHSKKLHSLKVSILEGSTVARVPDHYDSTRIQVFLGSLEVKHMIELEIQDW